MTTPLVISSPADSLSPSQIWRDHQVWLFRGVEGTLNCSASRDAQPTEGGGEGEGEGVADGDASGEDAEMVDALSEVERGASAGARYPLSAVFTCHLSSDLRQTGRRFFICADRGCKAKS